MKKIRILSLFIIGMFILTGCNKANSSDVELQILGVNTKNIEKIEIIHGNLIIYPDSKKKDNLTLISCLNTVLEKTGDRIETLGENLGIELADAEAYAQNDAENYYVYITFTDKQELSFRNNSNEEHLYCDGVLFDVENMKLHWSKDGRFDGTKSYNNPASVEREYSIFLNMIENTFANLGS